MRFKWTSSPSFESRYLPTRLLQIKQSKNPNNQTIPPVTHRLTKLWYNIGLAMIGDTTLKIHLNRVSCGYSTWRERFSGRSARRLDQTVDCGQPSSMAAHQYKSSLVFADRLRPYWLSMKHAAAMLGPQSPLARPSAPHALCAEKVGCFA